MTLHLVKLAIGSIRSRRTRSWLTVIGVLIGVTAVVSLLSIGTGVERAVLQQFEDIGYDVIVIAPGGMASLPGGAAPGSRFGRGQATVAPTPTGGTFDPSQIGQPTAAAAAPRISAVDTERLVQAVPGLIEAGNLGTRVVNVSGPGASGFLRLTTPSQSFLQAFPSILSEFKVQSGTSFASTATNEVVVGARSAASLGVGVGDTLTVDGAVFTVVGILAPSGAAGTGPEESDRSAAPGTPGALAGATRTGGASFLTGGLTNTDDSLFVLQERATSLWNAQDTRTTTIVRMAPGADVEQVLAGITAELTAQGVTGTPTSVQQIAASIQGVLGMIATVLASIAAVALIVGAVGMMNTMYTAVLERTREIGILKAVGARDGQVLALFLVDSGLMGLIGGVLGLVAGGVLSLFGTRLLGPVLGVGTFQPVFEVSLILGVVAASFVIGALSGAWPAWRASRLNPVEALAAE